MISGAKSCSSGSNARAHEPTGKLLFLVGPNKELLRAIESLRAAMKKVQEKEAEKEAKKVGDSLGSDTAEQMLRDPELDLPINPELDLPINSELDLPINWREELGSFPVKIWYYLNN